MNQVKGKEPKITMEMEKAGTNVLEAYRDVLPDYALSREVYNAMFSAAPSQSENHETLVEYCHQDNKEE